ncbi:hypothetical protein MK852_24030 [Shewanella benthica]|nr:hypothetical protein [Shewanella benthica]
MFILICLWPNSRNSHVDIAGSATVGHPHYGSPTATPLVGLYKYMTQAEK